MMYALLQGMEGSDLLYDTEERRGCMCLTWSTDDEMDHTQGEERLGENNGFLQWECFLE